MDEQQKISFEDDIAAGIGELTETAPVKGDQKALASASQLETQQGGDAGAAGADQGGDASASSATEGDGAAADGEGVDGEVQEATEGEATDGDGQAAAAEEKPQEKKPDPEEEQKVRTARRLADAVREEKKNRKDREANETRSKELDDKQKEIDARKPDLDLIDQFRKAPDIIEGLKVLVGGDDEKMAEIFLGLHKRYGSGEDVAAERPKGKSQEEAIQAAVDKAVAAALDADRKAQGEARKKAQAENQTAYVDACERVAEKNAEEFPFCSLGLTAKDRGDIAEITEEVYRETGRVPSPREVLREIETLKASEFEKRRKPKAATPEKSSEGKAKPAPAKTGTKTPAPVRRDSAPVNQTRTLSFEEDLAANLHEIG